VAPQVVISASTTLDDVMQAPAQPMIQQQSPISSPVPFSHHTNNAITSQSMRVDSPFSSAAAAESSQISSSLPPPAVSSPGSLPNNTNKLNINSGNTISPSPSVASSFNAPSSFGGASSFGGVGSMTPSSGGGFGDGFGSSNPRASISAAERRYFEQYGLQPPTVISVEKDASRTGFGGTPVSVRVPTGLNSGNINSDDKDISSADEKKQGREKDPLLVKSSKDAVSQGDDERKCSCTLY